MTPGTGAREAVRRVLGRLFTRARVHRLPEDRLLPIAHLPDKRLLAVTDPAAGPWEKDWQPSACVSLTSLAQIEVRLSEKESRPVARLAGGNAALLPPDCHAMPGLSAEGLGIESAALIGTTETGSLPEEFLKLPRDPLRLWQVAFVPAPGTNSAGKLSLVSPKVSMLRVPRLPGARIGPARTGESTLSRVALIRRGREAPIGIPMPVAFPAEHRRLAETAGLPPIDVALLGIFPGVPIIAVRRLVVEDEGRRLRLWLKPEAWWGRPSPSRITLLVGRQVSTGKMLQAAG